MTSKNKTPYWATPYRLRDRFVALQLDDASQDWHGFTISQAGTDRVVRWSEVAGHRTCDRALARLDELYKARHEGLTRLTGALFDAGERVLLRRLASEPADSAREPLTVTGTIIDPATGFMQVMVAERTLPLPIDQVEREVEPDPAMLAKIPVHDKWMTTEQKAKIGELALDHRQWYQTAWKEQVDAKAAASEAKKKVDEGVAEYNRQVTRNRARFWQEHESAGEAEKQRQESEGLFAGLDPVAESIVAILDGEGGEP